MIKMTLSLDQEVQEKIEKLSPEERREILFSLLYFANRPVQFEEIFPLYQIATIEEFKSTVVPIIEQIKAELASRSAAYTITIDYDDQTVHLHVIKEVLKKISFSNYIFQDKKIPRVKMKILAFITYKTVIRNELATLDEIIQNFGVTGLNQTYELENMGLIFQNRMEEKKKKKKIVNFELSNRFFSLLQFPTDPNELSDFLREEFIEYFEEDIDDELEEDLEVSSLDEEEKTP